MVKDSLKTMMLELCGTTHQKNKCILLSIAAHVYTCSLDSRPSPSPRAINCIATFDPTHRKEGEGLDDFIT